MSVTACAPAQLHAVESCPMCGAGEFATAISEPPYEVRRCRRCGMGWTSPRMDERGLSAIYKSDRYWRSDSPKEQGYGDYAGDESLYLDTFRKRLRFVLRDGPVGGRSLDIGSAAGFCMAAARELGFEAHGLELSPGMAAHTRERFGFASVHNGLLADAPWPDRHFTLITMWDVIEHTVDPAELLEQARTLLAPGGLLVLETQDIDSRFARLMGPRWHHLKHAEHVLHFTPATVTALLERCGYAVERLTHRYGGKYISTAFIAERSARVHPALSRMLSPLTRLRGARVYANVMDEMIVVARPR